MEEDSFANRIGRATEKEKADAARLEKLGFKVYPFGQSLFPDEARAFLRKQKHLYLRWLHDLLAIRIKDGWPILVDSKIGRKDTQNWVLEKDAHDAHRLQLPALGVTSVYIWPDGCSCSYVEDLTDEVLIDGSYHGKGSGTPFWLVRKELTRPLDTVLGSDIIARFPYPPRQVNFNPPIKEGTERARKRNYVNPDAIKAAGQLPLFPDTDL